ncbi:MAG: ABC transporter ATP-binding protein, partial [Verrucomicrobiia bacterium]
LRGEAEGPSAAERVLERLTLPEKKPEPQVAAVAPTEKIDSAKLDALAEAKKEPAPSPRVETPPPEDVLEQADKKLSGLLGDKS